jgi:hypothetical protein
VYSLSEALHGEAVPDPAILTLAQDESRQEMLGSVTWSAEYMKLSNLSIYLANRADMLVRVDLSTGSSAAWLLWGPGGAWGQEERHLATFRLVAKSVSIGFRVIDTGDRQVIDG